MEKKFKQEPFYRQAVDSYAALLVEYNDLLADKVRGVEEQKRLEVIDDFLRFKIKDFTKERLKGTGYNVDEFLDEVAKEASRKARLKYYSRLIPRNIQEPSELAPYLKVYGIKSVSELEKKTLRDLAELWHKRKEFEKEKELVDIKAKEVSAIAENPTDSNLLGYAFSKTYDRLGRAIKEVPLLGLTLALPFGGITDALLEYSNLRDIRNYLRSGRLTKEDFKDYLEGKITLKEVLEKISGWEDFVRKAQSEGRADYKEFIEKSLAMEATRLPFGIKSILKLGGELVGYSVLGKATSLNKLSEILTGKNLGGVLKDLSLRATRPETIMLKQVEEEVMRSAIDTSIAEVTKAAPLTLRAIPYEKLPKLKTMTELEKEFVKELKVGKTLSERIEAIYRDAHKKQVRETIMMDRLLTRTYNLARENINKALKVKAKKDVPEILIIDKQLDILQKYNDFIDDRIKKILKGGMEIEGVVNITADDLKKVSAYESIKRAIISAKTSLEEKFLIELSGFKTAEELAKLQEVSKKAIGKTAGDLLGRQIAIDSMRTVGMYLELPPDSPVIRNFYKVYNPYNIEHMKKVKTEMLKEIKPLKNITAEDLGITNKKIAYFWNLLPNKVKEFFIKDAQKYPATKEFLYNLISPYNFKRDPIAHRIINLDIVMTSKAATETQKLIEAKNVLFNKLGIKKHSELDYQLHKLLNKYQTWDEVVKDFGDKYAILEEPFKFIRSVTDSLATAHNTLNSAYLGPGHRLAAYMRINYFNPSNLDRMKLRLVNLEALSQLRGLTKEEKVEYSMLKKLISGYEENKDVISLAPWLPVSVSMPHLKKRTLADFGWKFSASEMFDDMVINAHKVIYEQPVLQAYFSLRDKIKDPLAKSYLHWYLKQSFGYKPVDSLQRVSSTITFLEYLTTIGWNIRTALGNSAQIISGLIDLGPGSEEYLIKALNHTLNKDAVFKRAYEKMPYLHQIMSMKETLRVEGRLFNKISDSAFYLMSKIELFNRWYSYFTGYLMALDKGGKIPEVAKYLKLGYSLEEAAVKYGSEVMKRTQYIYGKGMPKLWSETLLRPLLPYYSFPLKTVELFIDWAQKNPEKLFAYILIANEFYDTTNQLGIDLANFFTLGIEFDYLYKGIVNLGIDNKKALDFIKKSGMSIFSGGGIIQFEIPAVGIMKNLLSATYEFIDKQPLIAYDKSKIIGVIANFSTPMRRIYRGIRALEYGPVPEARPIAREDIKSILLEGKRPEDVYTVRPDVVLRIYDEKDNVKYFTSLAETISYMIGFYPVEQRRFRELDIATKELKKDYKGYTDAAIRFYKEMLFEIQKLMNRGYKVEDIINNDKIRELHAHYLDNLRLAYAYLPNKEELKALRTKIKNEAKKLVGARYQKDILRTLFEFMRKRYQITDSSIIDATQDFINNIREE